MDVVFRSVPVALRPGRPLQIISVARPWHACVPALWQHACFFSMYPPVSSMRMLMPATILVLALRHCSLASHSACRGVGLAAQVIRVTSLEYCPFQFLRSFRIVCRVPWVCACRPPIAKCCSIHFCDSVLCMSLRECAGSSMCQRGSSAAHERGVCLSPATLCSSLENFVHMTRMLACVVYVWMSCVPLGPPVPLQCESRVRASHVSSSLRHADALCACRPGQMPSRFILKMCVFSVLQFQVFPSWMHVFRVPVARQPCVRRRCLRVAGSV